VSSGAPHPRHIYIQIIHIHTIHITSHPDHTDKNPQPQPKKKGKKKKKKKKILQRAGFKPTSMSSIDIGGAMPAAT
jgi:hypothetical protein